MTAKTDKILTELIDALIDEEDKDRYFEEFKRFFKKGSLQDQVSWTITVTKRRMRTK